ncbi:MAG: hypothetical protein AB4368_15995 [Xenococcaceae cyanobacterium]
MTKLAKCTLHTGLAKTGSTQIQQFIKFNGNTLSKNDISWAIYNHTLDLEYRKFIWNAQPGGQEWINSLISTSKHFILSHEDIIGKFCIGTNGVLFDSKKIYLNRLLNLIPSETLIELFIFIREYSSWIESSYLQVVFNRKKIPKLISINDYLVQNNIDISKLDWFNLVSEISSIERISKIIVCQYEEYKKNNDAFYQYFEEHIGLKLDRLPEKVNFNMGLSAPAYEIMMASSSLSSDERVQLRSFLKKTYPVSKYKKPQILPHDIKKILTIKYIDDLNKIKNESIKNNKIQCLFF